MKSEGETSKRLNVKTSKRRNIATLTTDGFLGNRVMNMRNPFVLAWVVIVIGWSSIAAGQALRSQYTMEIETVNDDEFHIPVDDTTAARIELHIEGLDSPLYRQREESVKQLTAIGAGAFARLRQVYRLTDGLETRLRIEDIVHGAYLDRHVFDRNGFLGIQQQRVPQTNDDDPRILEGHYGVAIGKIIENTAAQDHDVRVGDVIIALDGEPLKLVDGNLNQSFGESLRTRGPGTLVLLTILRGEEQIEMEIPLGRRPIHLYARQGVVTAQLAAVERNFGVWWVRFFRNPPTAAPTNE